VVLLNMSGIRSMPSRIAKPDMGIPTTSSAGARVITPDEGTGATVNETRNVAKIAPPSAVIGKGTSKRWARKTIAAPWKSALPARYIDAPRGRTRSATGSETPRLPLTSSSVTGSAATVLVVENASDAAPNVAATNFTGLTLAKKGLRTGRPLFETLTLFLSLQNFE